MGKEKKSMMKNESMMDEPEARGSALRNNKKVSSEDVTNTNDTDAADEFWDVLRVIEDPNETCNCRTEQCEYKVVVVWAIASDPTDEWPLCEECQEKDFGGWPANITPPKHVLSSVHKEDEETPESKEAADEKDSDEVAREEKTEDTAQATPTADNDE
jgi:hypothetical protein